MIDLDLFSILEATFKTRALKFESGVVSSVTFDICAGFSYIREFLMYPHAQLSFVLEWNGSDKNLYDGYSGSA